MQSKKLALAIREAAEDKKAEDLVVLDVSKLTNLTRFFIVTHGNSERHVRSIADHVAETLKKKKVALLHQEGKESGQWVLLDYGDVILHIFYRDIREFYNLERLWGEAPRL